LESTIDSFREQSEPRARTTCSLADEAGLATIRRSIRVDLDEAGADSSDLFDCLVAVTEACTNALLHGRGEAAPRVSWEIQACTARFWVQDYSRQQWSKVAHPSRVLVPDAGTEDRIGGWGLDLIEGLMDEVDIRNEAHGTTVELAKRLC